MLEWYIANTARTPIAMTIMAAISSIMPKPAWERDRWTICRTKAYTCGAHRHMEASTQAE
jgi:hypothetical protein